MASQSDLCICWTKWKAKLIVSIYFGTKARVSFVSESFLFRVTGVRLKFRFKRLRNTRQREATRGIPRENLKLKSSEMARNGSKTAKSEVNF